MKTVTVGQRVTCNGFDGTVVTVCTGQLNGMCEVRLGSGTVCVSISEILRFSKK
jgi:molybdopterin-binding protein